MPTKKSKASTQDKKLAKLDKTDKKLTKTKSDIPKNRTKKSETIIEQSVAIESSTGDILESAHGILESSTGDILSTKTTKDYKLRAQIAKALAHPSRMFILDVLQSGDICVCELTKMIGADQSTVSKHLAILKHAGLIEDRKQGTNIYYHLLCPCLQQFFECIEQVVDVKARQYNSQMLGSSGKCNCLRTRNKK